MPWILFSVEDVHLILINSLQITWPSYYYDFLLTTTPTLTDICLKQILVMGRVFVLGIIKK